jgi:hypothetical protein
LKDEPYQQNTTNKALSPFNRSLPHPIPRLQVQALCVDRSLNSNDWTMLENQTIVRKTGEPKLDLTFYLAINSDLEGKQGLPFISLSSEKV